MSNDRYRGQQDSPVYASANLPRRCRFSEYQTRFEIEPSSPANERKPVVNHLFQSLTIPDLWQQEAVRALRNGQDVVVHAPTGAGKTYIFELLYPQLKGQAVFTVPTRALANDKLAEWRARGWDVGIATGDVAERLDAKVVVATLETQKGRFLKREGPSILIIDEYQMIGDPVRGVNYELAIALAPADTQLLLLSGSVANPQDVVAWLKRIGRDAVLIAHKERPVPLEEIDLQGLPNRAGHSIRGWWSRVVTNALKADLGPILLFAPRRNAAEDLAVQLAAALPNLDPLKLSPEQEALAGPKLVRLLRSRVAFHHSGLSYAQRAGLVEPLAKRGELRVVVATMGLAAGINFSMRSVAITGTRYMAGNFERTVQPDELLQMFGRAGRRGLDETGYALVTEQPPRLLDARAKQLRRAQQIDWPTLIAVMQGATVSEQDETSASETDLDLAPAPFRTAAELNSRLFTIQSVPIGVEHSVETGAMPCGLWVDMERARFARRGVTEMWSSTSAWETAPAAQTTTLGQAWVWQARRSSNPPSEQGVTSPPAGRWVPSLSVAETLKTIGLGNLTIVDQGERHRTYGREIVIGTRQAGGFLSLSPTLRKKAGMVRVDSSTLQEQILARLPEFTQGGTLLKVFTRGEQLVAHLSYSEIPVKAFIDSAGCALIEPPQQRELPMPCRGCEIRDPRASTKLDANGNCRELSWCLETPIQTSPAHAWRSLELIDAEGHPTRRGIIFSFFQHGEGLAVAAALEDEKYLIEELVFDLANLRAGPRFSGDESPYSGHLAIACQQAYSRADLAGYLEMGVPTDYGAGASEVVRDIVQHSVPRQKLLTEALRMGDLERAIVEWRSLLRHVAFAPDYPWDRWQGLQEACAQMLRRLSE